MASRPWETRRSIPPRSPRWSPPPTAAPRRRSVPLRATVAGAARPARSPPHAGPAAPPGRRSRTPPPPAVRRHPRLARDPDCRCLGLGFREHRSRRARRRLLGHSAVPDDGGPGPAPRPGAPRLRARRVLAMTTPPILTRIATAADAEAIAAIYNQGIADRIATFETEPRTAEQIAALLADKGDRYPTGVAAGAGRLVAGARAGAYRSRPAYSGVAEHSVYVARAARGTGAGRVTLNALRQLYPGRALWQIGRRAVS